jgi:hypothetical protein
MRLSVWILVAAFAAGAAGASVGYAQQYGQQAPATAVPVGPSGYTYVQSGDTGSSGPLGLGIGRRLSGMFRRSGPTVTPMTTSPRVIQQSAEPPIAEPLPARSPAPTTPAAPSAPAAYPVVPPAASPGVTQMTHREEQPAKTEAKKEQALRTAVADDGSWIIGELHYLHTDGGRWVLRYAPLDKEDRYGGAVVLANNVDMSKYREGDFVFVRGQILDEGRATKHSSEPLYRVTSIDLNERPGAQ